MWVSLLYAHEHVPEISPENTPNGIRWDATNESYVCRKSDPNFERTYWKYQYQIGGFKLSGTTWLAQVGEGRPGERVFLHKRNGQVCFVKLKKMAFEDEDAQYFHIEFLENEFDGEIFTFDEVRSVDGSDDEDVLHVDADRRPTDVGHTVEELEAAVALMQLRAKPFLLRDDE